MLTPRKGHPDGLLAWLGVGIAAVITFAAVLVVVLIARSRGAA